MKDESMNDKVAKFGNCAHNLAPNVDAVFRDLDTRDESPLEFFVGYAIVNLHSLESLVMATEIDGDDTAVTLANLVEVGMAGAAYLLGMEDRVDALADQMTDLYARKNRDYGGSFDKSMDKFGLVVAAIRIGDKVNRLQSLIAKGSAEVKDESIADTFIDLACYSIMTLMWCAGQIENGASPTPPEEGLTGIAE